MWYTNHMTTNNNIVSRAWVSDFTGIDFGRIADFDIDKGMLTVTVTKDFNPDFEHYLDGFSKNVQDIIANFEFRNQIDRLSKANALGTLIESLRDALGTLI